jgi:acetyl-CoA C-acetyltransferase
VAGFESSSAGRQLNRFCASGLEAVKIAAVKVCSGWEDLIIAGRRVDVADAVGL